MRKSQRVLYYVLTLTIFDFNFIIRQIFQVAK